MVPVVALVERGGEARSKHVARVTAKELQGSIHDHVDPKARVMTDEFASYRTLSRSFDHSMVAHRQREYVRGDIHTNTVEGPLRDFETQCGVSTMLATTSTPPICIATWRSSTFAIVLRGVSDAQRTTAALAAAEGKRLKYREPIGESR